MRTTQEFTATRDADDAAEAGDGASASATAGATGTLSYAHVPTDRRTAPRQKQMFVTQMTPWAPGHPSIPFEVILEDTSDTGAGVIGERPAKIGLRHLLMVPRAPGERPVMGEYNIVRCDLRADGKYSIGLELIGGLTAALTTEPAAGETDATRASRKKTSPLKAILLAIALVGLLVALFMPL